MATENYSPLRKVSMGGGGSGGLCADGRRLCYHWRSSLTRLVLLLMLLATTGVLLALPALRMPSPAPEKSHHAVTAEPTTRPANILDGCYHVYLDVGSNVGIQVRKCEAKPLGLFSDLSHLCRFESSMSPNYIPNLGSFMCSTRHLACQGMQQYFFLFNFAECAFSIHSKRVTQQICAVGFEPNPHHATRLHQLEEAYVKCGWRVK